MSKRTILCAAVGSLVALMTMLPASASTPRPEYPRPQFERSEWINLNGQWNYCFDFSNSGMERRLFESKGFEDEITVPFAPQCELSGVGYKDFISEMWYHRTIDIPGSWDGSRIILHFGAVDYTASVYVDGKIVGRHWGGSSSFSIDITRLVTPGQSHDLDQSRFVVEPRYYALAEGQQLRVRIKDGDKVVSEKIVPTSEQSRLELPLKKVKTWSPESPFLYGVELDVLFSDGTVIDHVDSYSGMRKISIIGNKIYLNNKPIYLRLVLDQGFYPEGTWTAPSDEALKKDIELSLAAGFNGARLHQKVFEERFHYWADKLGYLTWGESSSWGGNINKTTTARNFLSEWEEIVVRDRNHPSIIVWTPFNETWEHPDDREMAREACRLVTDVYHLTKSLDYRPCHDVSGNYHVITDIFTIHQYEQEPARFADVLAPKDGRLPQADLEKREVEYDGQPYLVDEYGGIKWVVGQQFSDLSWGYGNGPRTIDEFYDRLQALTGVILGYDHICGYCYTQFTDVEQEQNGIYNYDRTKKFDMEKVRAIFSKVPQDYK